MLTRYEPMAAMRQIHDEMNRAFGRDLLRADVAREHKWVPAVDIREEDDRYVVVADIPGVDPADIEVTTEKNVLTVKGERKSVSADDSAGYRRVERLHGTFYRQFTLPEGADADKVEASGKHGVLEIAIPKKEPVVARRVPVAA